MMIPSGRQTTSKEAFVYEPPDPNCPKASARKHSSRDTAGRFPDCSLRASHFRRSGARMEASPQTVSGGRAITMIIHVNHMEAAGTGPAAVDARAAEVVRTLLGVVAAGHGDPRALPSLRVHLDWIQYRANFREPVIVRRAADPAGTALALAEIAVDLRRVDLA